MQNVEDPKAPYLNPELPLEERLNDLMGRMKTSEKAALMLHEAAGIDRLGILPYDWWSEGLHGVARAGKATVFPQAIGMAATFDPALLQTVADAISDEARAKHHAFVAQGNYKRYTGLTYWSPNVNIFRDQRWGRGHETYGEDPYLTGELGAAFVRGLQGDDPKYMKIAACAKHYAVHSGPEADRHTFNAVASERDLRETYLPAFKRLVEEGVESVMGAYNKTNGEPCCASPRLISQILRGEWGFDGHFLSDCWAIRDFHTTHKVTKTPEESAALAVKEGCDLNCGCTYEYLLEALKQGLLTEEDIDRSARRLMRTRFKLGMFDPAERVPYASIPQDVVCCDKHRALARKTAQRSCVLLKNEGGVLPLRKNLKQIYVVGPNAANVDVLLGNYYGASQSLVTVLEGIVGAVDMSTIVEFKKGCECTYPNTNPRDWVSHEASRADAVIAVMGLRPELEGEEGDAFHSLAVGDRADLSLPPHQIEFVRQLHKAGSKVILVLTGGSAIAEPELYDLAAAVLWVGYPGQEGGNAIADLIFGDVAPSGRLPMTFPRSVDDLPAFDDYSMRGRTYRFAEKEPLFPFGFGLSYTTFEYADLRLSAAKLSSGGRLTLNATVRNTGTRDADEVVQLYVRDIETSVPAPLWSLRGFRRVSLAAGASTTVEFTIDTDMLQLYDDHGRPFLEAGEFEVQIGGASPGKRARELGAAAPVTARFVLEV